jgi:transcriptional regulator with PAS, ATPase and Fis domain
MNYEVSEALTDSSLPEVRLPQFDEPVYIGKSEVIREVLAKLDPIAKAEVPVLITGESGTGKEIIARLIHYKSSARPRPFVAINSAALPKDVVDNELFGHEKEAYTGAISTKPGCFELARRGTLFLDEIAEMHPQTQAKLLRAIENKSFRRLGGREEVRVEARIIAATNRDVPAALSSGEFRVDLYYRLNVIEIALAPLRERREDIELLIEYFNSKLSVSYGKRAKQFHPESLELLRMFEWPGNIRELRNVVERLILVCPDDLVLPRHLPPRISKQNPGRSSVLIPIGTSMKDAEQLLITQTLATMNNNKSAAARILGLTRKTLHKKLAKKSSSIN